MSQVTHTVATAEEITPIIENLEMALEGCSRGHAIISCLSIAILLQHPAITAEDLQKVVKECSEFLCLLLEGTAGTIDPASKLVLN